MNNKQLNFKINRQNKLNRKAKINKNQQTKLKKMRLKDKKQNNQMENQKKKLLQKVRQILPRVKKEEREKEARQWRKLLMTSKLKTKSYISSLKINLPNIKNIQKMKLICWKKLSINMKSIKINWRIKPKSEMILNQLFTVLKTISTVLV